MLYMLDKKNEKPLHAGGDATNRDLQSTEQ